MGGRNGQFFTLFPIADTKYRIVSTLCTDFQRRLPFVAGANARQFRTPHFVQGYPARRNIEDGHLLSVFPFLSAPLQQELAERMQIPLGRKKLVSKCRRHCSRSWRSACKYRWVGRVRVGAIMVLLHTRLFTMGRHLGNIEY